MQVKPVPHKVPRAELSLTIIANHEDKLNLDGVIVSFPTSQWVYTVTTRSINCGAPPG